MKKSKYFFIGSLILLFCNQSFSQNSISIGKHTYLSKGKTIYWKDYDLHLNIYTYFLKNGSAEFAYEELAQRNDSIFRKGKLQINKLKKEVIAITYNFYNLKDDFDSSYRYFKQLKNGKFKLNKIIQYKNGFPRTIPLQ